MPIESLVAIIVSIIGATLGFIGTILSIKNNKLARSQVMGQYYNEGDSDEIKQLRKRIFDKMQDGAYDFEDSSHAADIGKMMGFFDKWALLCNSGYLPISVFEGNPGYLLVSFYEYTKDYILLRRSQKFRDIQNNGYAVSIERLAKKLRKNINTNVNSIIISCNFAPIKCNFEKRKIRWSNKF